MEKEFYAAFPEANEYIELVRKIKFNIDLGTIAGAGRTQAMFGFGQCKYVSCEATAQMHGEQLKLMRVFRTHRPVSGPGVGIRKRHGDVQADRRIHLRFDSDTGCQIEALNERRLKLPRQAILADLDGMLQDALQIGPFPGLVNCREAGMFVGGEFLDVFFENLLRFLNDSILHYPKSNIESPRVALSAFFRTKQRLTGHLYFLLLQL